jgi:hypothetical protein
MLAEIYLRKLEAAVRAAMCPRGHSRRVFDKEGRDPFEKSHQRL